MGHSYSKTIKRTSLLQVQLCSACPSLASKNGQPLELLAAASGLMGVAYSGGVPGGGEGARKRVKFQGVIGGSGGPRLGGGSG